MAFAVPCNIGRIEWRSGSFVPRGGLLPFGRAEAQFGGFGRSRPKILWEQKETAAARLFVGFNVGAEARYSVDDLVPIVRRVRSRQTRGRAPDATFMLQKGIYKSRRGRQIVEEDGAQIVIIDTIGVDPQKFENQMLELAAEIADQLSQESVIVEIQKNGVTQKTVGVAAEGGR